MIFIILNDTLISNNTLILNDTKISNNTKISAVNKDFFNLFQMIL